MKTRIGSDVDEVLADFIEPLLNYSNPRFGTHLKRDDLKDYSLSKAFGISIEEELNVLEWFHKDGFLSVIGTVEGSVEGTRHLNAKNYELYAVTARPSKLSLDTIRWLDNNFFTTSYHGIFTAACFANGYEGYAGNGTLLTKASICKMLNIGVLIEDRVDYATECADAGIEVLLLDCPWNKDLKENGKIKRVNGWNDIIKIF